MKKYRELTGVSAVWGDPIWGVPDEEDMCM